ncbi:hypothetical protein BH09ACT10_BH09ACT10_11320 [soil metagenome]
MPQMFVNMPVTDLERAKAFYAALDSPSTRSSPTTTQRASSSKKTTATS